MCRFRSTSRIASVLVLGAALAGAALGALGGCGRADDPPPERSVSTQARALAGAWQLGFGSVGFDDAALAIARDASNNALVTGYFNGTVNLGGGNLVSAGSVDAFVAKYAAANGAHVWSRRFGGTSADYGYGVAADASGNVFVAGYFQGTADFGGGNLVSAGSYDIFLAKYAAANGAHLWSKRIGGTSADYVRGIAVDASGNVAVAGYYSGTVDFGGGSLTSAGSTDVFVAKYSGADGAHLWSKKLGSTSADYGYGVGVDASGNVVVAGNFQGTVDFGGGSLTSAGSNDVFVAKYAAANGTHLWSKRFGGTGADAPYGLAVDASGNVAVTGYFNGTADFGGGNLVSAGSTDMFVAKYAAATGAHLWSKKLGSTSADYGYAVATTSTGDVVLTGYFQGTVDFGGGNLASAGSYDIAVARYAAANGAHVWSKKLGASSADYGYAVSVDGAGDVLLGGAFQGTVDFGGGGLASAAGLDLFVAKYAGATGAYTWAQRYGSYGGTDLGQGVALDSSGNATVVGRFYNSANFGGGAQTSAGSADAFVARYAAANGGHLWSKRLGGTGTDEAKAVANDANGDAVVIGYFNGTVNFGGGNQTSAGSSDIWLAKYAAANGAHLWSKKLGGTGADYGYAVATDAGGSVFASGEFSGTVNFGGGNLVSAGSYDVFLGKYSGANGAHLWSRKMGGTGSDYGRAVAVDPSGNPVVTGYFNGTTNLGGSNLASAGSTDVYVAKYSGASGAHLWSRKMGGTGADYAYAVAIDAKGDVYVTGYFNGAVDFGGGVLTSAGGADIFLAKYAGGTGAHLWSKRFGGTSSDVGYGLAVDRKGNVILTGYFYGSVDFGGGVLAGSGYDVVVASYAGATGAHLWSKKYGGSSSDYGRAVAVDGAGFVTVTGDFGGTATFEGGSVTAVGSQDVFVARVSTTPTCGNGVAEVGEECDGDGCCSSACVLDPLGDHNSCTVGETCLATVRRWYGGTNTCAAPMAFAAKPTAGGIKLTWTNPTQAGFAAIEIYRTSGSQGVAQPGTAPEAFVYGGVGTTFTDVTAPAGKQLTYTAFALYPGGWSMPSLAIATVADSDGDGMADGWEIANGFDPYNPGDALLDADGDGLTNVAEYAAGTNAHVADTDGDGIVDGEEVLLGLNPLSQDSDGDGMSDRFEIATGLDPLNGHDFAIGDFSISNQYVLGAYTFDSGKYVFDATGQPAIGSATKELVLASQGQLSGIGPAGSATRYGYAGYLYTTEEFIAPNYPPVCNAGLDRAVTLPATVALSGSASDPNGDPVTYSWTFFQKPTGSTATLTNATTATPSFTPDKFGYYMLELSVRDVTGTYGAPCYVTVTAIDGQLLYQTGPFTALSANYKLIAHTNSAAGGLPTPLASATRKLGQVFGDRGPGQNSASPDTTGRQVEGGFLSTAYTPYDMPASLDNVAPVAVAGSDQTLTSTATVTLDGSASYDPDGYPSPLTYVWTVWQRPVGSTATLTSTTTAVTSFTPDRAGSYVFTLKVSDGNLSSVPDAVIITVANTPPVADAGPDRFVDLTSPPPLVTLDGSGSHDPEGSAITYKWRFFRIPAGSIATLTNSTTATPSFTPDKAGYYRLELVVKDGILPSAPAYTTVHVGDSTGNQLPVAVVGPSQSLVGVNSTGLDGSGSYDPDWDKVTWPDPDAQGVFRKGLGYDWVILQKPTGSTANIRCTTTQSPVSDCPNPVLYFNGYNGTYLIGLRVIDGDLGTSDQVTVAVTAAAIPNEPPVAVALPTFKKINFKDPLARTVALSGTASFDPINASETLTYTWTLVEKPAGSTATLSSTTSATPNLTLDRIGRFRAHLKVCDTTGKCSCGPTETRPGDAYCNQRSFAVISTSDDAVRVSMPAGWPAAGLPGGSGGRLTLLKSDDGVYDKPVVMTVGFNGFFAAAGGAAGQSEFGPFASVIETLRQRGYDVWWLSYDPICSGGSTPNLDANWAWGGQEFCQTTTCACPYPEQPVDNRISLNAVVLAYAIKQAKAYDTCGAKSADDPTNPCFVRVFGPSMGGVISRYALAWAEDATKVTVPFAAGETAPYALNGLRAKPTGVTAWDLGARVFVAGDAPMQGANVPISLQALVKGFEANTPDPGAAGGSFGGIGFQTSGFSNIVAWSFLNHRGLRNWFIDHKAQLDNVQDIMALGGFGGKNAQGLVGLVTGLWTVYKILKGTLAVSAFGIGFAAVSGFLEGMVDGWGTAVIGAVILGSWAYLETQLLLYLCSLGPWGVLAAVIFVILDFFFNFGSFLFSVKTKFEMDIVEEKSQVQFTPFSMTKILEAPAAREMLYETVTSFKTCDDMPMLAQGKSVPNTWPAGFGKEKNGRMCRGTPNITVNTADHDQFYAFLKSLNGGKGYPLLTRNVGMAFGSGEPGLSADTPILELYLPYVLSNQQYPSYPRDREPGSIYGTELVSHLVPFQMWIKGVLEIKKRILFHTSTSHKTLFDDKVYFPEQALAKGATWAFIPTQSALDLQRPGTCSSQLPCCQVMPRGVTPHPQDDGQQNCCQCTTPFDAIMRPDINLLHAAPLFVNPCLRGQNPESPLIESLRTGCVAPNQGEQPGQSQMCKGDATWYLEESAQGFTCSPIHDDGPTRAALELMNKAIAQIDTRNTCAATSATFVCLNGAASCTAAEGQWFWVGGHDKDGDGCPGPKLANGTTCATYCETDAQDGDSTVVGHLPQGNSAPAITAISPTQMFGLPICSADPTARTYMCQASRTSNGAELSLSVTASDPNGDPLTYRWEFLPDAAQGQLASDLALSNSSSRTPKVSIRTVNRPPQGTYRLRVTVADNKGGLVSSETSVAVPGDAPPAVSVAGPTSVNEICEYEADADMNDAWRCYADLQIFGSVTDPDGPDSTSILMVWWEDITDRETSGYRGVSLVDDASLLNAGIEVYASEDHVATPIGYPLRFKLTAVDIRGQVASAEVAVQVCQTAGCQ